METDHSGLVMASVPDRFACAAEEAGGPEPGGVATLDAPPPGAAARLVPAPRARASSAALEPIRRRLARELGAERYSKYFDHQAGLRLHGDLLEVVVATQFMADLLAKRFADLLREIARAETGRPELRVRLVVEDAATPPRIGAPASPAPQPAAPTPPARRPRAGMVYRLEDFIVGPSNRLAFEAAVRLTEGAPHGASPLFIHGPCGVGKTHLLQGVATRFREAHPSARLRYVTGEAFTNDFIAAVRAGRTDSFRASYRNVDLLCLDDVHFLASKEATQAELLHTFDAIDLGGARVVLASDEHPRHIRKFSQALVSRFMAGMVARLESPDREMRERLVAALAARRGVRLDAAAVAAIAERGGAGGTSRTALDGACSVRELEGLVTKVEAVWRLLPELSAGGEGAIGWAVVARALGEGAAPARSASARPVRPLRVEHVTGVVCRDLNVELDELMGRGRHPRVVLARSVTAFLCRRLTTLSFPEIARGMGRPNHSTVVTAVQRVERDIAAAAPAEAKGDLAGVPLKDLCDRLADRIVRENSGR
ncbi:MAG TPA: DnaA/Hda family protein [Phycisphaerales bacterium]|nr:DnaA/Hda family protein [Phycisphaerales bacterium]